MPGKKSCYDHHNYVMKMLFFRKSRAFSQIHKPYMILRSRLSQCTRWSELTETLRFHIHAARLSAAPSQFRMLNGK